MTLTALLDRAEQAPRRTTEVQVLFDLTAVDRLETLNRERLQIEAELEQIETGLGFELAAIEGDLRASDPRPGKLRKAAEAQTKPIQARLDTITAEIGEVNAAAAADLVTFRFTALPGWEWTDITARSQPRDDVDEDKGRRYNLDEVCRIVAGRSGVIVTGEDTTEPVSEEEWDRVWKIAPPVALLELKSSIWYLNEYQWDAAREAALIAARKAFEAKAAGQTSPSPSDSVSQPAA